VSAAFPIRFVGAEQPEEDLVDQLGRTQRQHAALAAQQLPGDLVQVVVKQADRLVARPEIARAPFDEQPRDVVTVVHLDSSANCP